MFQGTLEAEDSFKVSAFCMRIFHDGLATVENLAGRGVLLHDDENLCLFCQQVQESTSHIFFSCTSRLWSICYTWINLLTASHAQPIANFLLHIVVNLLGLNSCMWKMFWPAITWVIWSTRNNKVFNGKQWDLKQMMAEVLYLV